jgi:hypothetical protein
VPNVTYAQNNFERIRWYSYVTRLKSKVGFSPFRVVLILTQERCMVCAVHTIGLEIVFDAPDGTPI